MVETTFYALCLLVGPILWGLIFWMMLLGRRRMNLVKKPYEPLPAPPPPLSILIPAKDEQERINVCLASALAQDYPDFEVLAIDDRSVDRTGVIMDRMAADDPRLHVVHIQPGTLPAGWTGKCNALHTAVAQARGEWLLFVDSDVVLQPQAASATLAVSHRKRFDLLSLMPAMESHTLWERLVVPLAGGAVAGLCAAALTNLQNTRVAFANGQYMLIRRSAYQAIGGHVPVRDCFCEDLAIARLLKSRGFRPRVSWGADLIAVRMYDSLPRILRGWARIFYGGDGGKTWRIWLGILLVLTCAASLAGAVGMGLWRAVHPARPGGDWAWLAAAAVQAAAVAAGVALTYRWTHNPRRYVLLLPVAAGFLLLIFFKALGLCFTGRVEWRGTPYTASSSA